MKRILGTLNRKEGNRHSSPGRSVDFALPQADSPEGIVIREVTTFCESGGPNSQNAGDEYLHLPAIVDQAESSPSAAREAANCIRRFLSKQNSQRAYAQYNAIMLTRILTDNPGKSFTKNFDQKFVATVKELLREGRDISVQQILREALDYLEREKVVENDTLVPLVEMWKKEKAKTAAKHYGNSRQPPGPRTLNAPPFQQHQSQNYFARHHRSPRALPPADELAARIEEARTTAKLLAQTIQSTPSAELIGSDLIREFADRASSASRSIQGYINSNDPAPDEDTMLTLIETNEQLGFAMSKYQRGMLQARKAMSGPPGRPSPPPPGQNMYPSPLNPQQNLDPYAPRTGPLHQFEPNHDAAQHLPQHYSQNHYTPPALPHPFKSNHDAAQSPPQHYGQNHYAFPGPPRPHDQKNFPPPPPGPPPSAIALERPEHNSYSSAPSIPPRKRPISLVPTPPPSQALNYGIAENPFAEEAAHQQASHQQSYNLYDRPSDNTPPPQQRQQQEDMTDDSLDSPPRQQYPGYDHGYHPTPSYLGQQESSSKNFTIHRATPTPPPPPDTGDERESPVWSPVSPDQASHNVSMNGIGRQMGNMRM